MVNKVSSDDQEIELIAKDAQPNSQQGTSPATRIAIDLLLQKSSRLQTHIIKNYRKVDSTDEELIRKQIDYITEMLSDDPNNVSLLTERGNHYLNLKMHAEAEADYNRVSAIDEFYPDANYGLGIIHLAQKQFSKAQIKLTAANAFIPNNGFIISALAEAYLGLGKVDEANIVIDVPMEIFDTFTKQEHCLYSRVNSKIYLAMNCLTSADEQIENLDSFEDLQLKAQINYLTNFFVTAADNYEQLVNDYACTDEEREYFMMQSALNYLLGDQDDNYKTSLKELIKTFPNSPYRDLLEGVWAHFSNAENTVHLLKTFLRKKPNDPIGLLFLGREYSAQDKNIDALNCFNTIVKNDPFNYKAIFERGLVYNDMSQHKEALNEFETCAKYIHLEMGEEDKDLTTDEGFDIFKEIAVTKSLLGLHDEGYEILDKLNRLDFIDGEQVYGLKLAYAAIHLNTKKYTKCIDALDDLLRNPQKLKKEQKQTLLEQKAIALYKRGSPEDLKNAFDICNQDMMKSDLKVLKEKISKKLKLLDGEQSKPINRSKITLTRKDIIKKRLEKEAAEKKLASEAAEKERTLKEEQDKQRLELERKQKLEQDGNALKAAEAALKKLEIEAYKKAHNITLSGASGSSRKSVSKELKPEIEKVKEQPQPRKIRISQYDLSQSRNSALAEPATLASDFSFFQKIEVESPQSITISHTPERFQLVSSTRVFVPSKTEKLATGMFGPVKSRMGPEFVQEISNTLLEIEILLSDDTVSSQVTERLLISKLRKICDTFLVGKQDLNINSENLATFNELMMFNNFINSKTIILSVDQLNQVATSLATSKFALHIGKLADTNTWPTTKLAGTISSSFQMPLETDEELVKAIRRELVVLKLSLNADSKLNQEAFKISLQLIMDAVAAIQDISLKEHIHSQLFVDGLKKFIKNENLNKPLAQKTAERLNKMNLELEVT